MNVDIRDQLLAEGFRKEQLLSEDWEALKKELANLYVAGKITERQVQTRLSRAGMGPLAANAAHRIATEHSQKREENLQKAQFAEAKLKKARELATSKMGPKRGELAQAYCDSWNKKFGHIVKAKTVYESLKNAFENNDIIYEDKDIEGYFVNLCEEVNSIGDKKMTEKELTKIFEDTLTEAFSLEKLKKGAKRAALGAALVAAPGIVSGISNVNAQRENRKTNEISAQYDKAQNDTKRAEMEKKIRDSGIQMGKEVEKASKVAKDKSKEVLKKGKEKFEQKVREHKAKNANPAIEEPIIKASVKTNYFPY